MKYCCKSGITKYFDTVKTALCMTDRFNPLVPEINCIVWCCKTKHQLTLIPRTCKVMVII